MAANLSDVENVHDYTQGFPAVSTNIFSRLLLSTVAEFVCFSPSHPFPIETGLGHQLNH